MAQAYRETFMQTKAGTEDQGLRKPIHLPPQSKSWEGVARTAMLTSKGLQNNRNKTKG